VLARGMPARVAARYAPAQALVPRKDANRIEAFDGTKAACGAIRPPKSTRSRRQRALRTKPASNCTYALA
jgi:hypothetical protein